MLEPPMFFGVASSNQAWMTGRVAYRKKPSSATIAMNSGEPPLKAMSASTPALVSMLLIRMRLRPMRSDRCPATGAAAKPAACRAKRQAPTRAGEYPISRARNTGRKVSSAACVMVRNEEPAASSTRSEEHTSELQSPCNLVCRLLLEKKKKRKNKHEP